jgi:hypothetical protein
MADYLQFSAVLKGSSTSDFGSRARAVLFQASVQRLCGKTEVVAGSAML